MDKRMLAAAVLCGALTGCAPTGGGTAPFIDPANYNGQALIPDPPAVTSPAPPAPAGDTVFTEDAQWEVRDGHLVHEEFLFSIPPLWQAHFRFNTDTKTVMGEEVRVFDFNYCADTGETLCLMRVECYPTALAEELGLAQSRDAALTDASGSRTYLLAVRLDNIPEEASYTGDCVAIAGSLLENSGFRLLV